MNPSDPYSPSFATQVNSADGPANLDLSKLTAVEKKALETLLPKKTGLSCRAAWIVGILHLISLIVYCASGNLVGSSVTMISIKMVCYFVLGYWARSWSPLAAFVVLAFHVFIYFPAVTSFDRVGLVFLFFAFIFLFGFIEAKTRAKLIQKAGSPGFTKPTGVEQPANEPVKSTRPRFRTPGEITYKD